MAKLVFVFFPTIFPTPFCTPFHQSLQQNRTGSSLKNAPSNTTMVISDLVNHVFKDFSITATSFATGPIVGIRAKTRITSFLINKLLKLVVWIVSCLYYLRGESWKQLRNLFITSNAQAHWQSSILGTAGAVQGKMIQFNRI